jgi:hypothetical protein
MEAFFVETVGERSGEKDGKPWKVVSFLIETKGKYPKKVLLEGFNAISDTVSALNPKDEIEVVYEPEAREYNGRWYNTIRCNKLELLTKAEKAKTTKKKAEVTEVDSDDQLPF